MIITTNRRSPNEKRQPLSLKKITMDYCAFPKEDSALVDRFIEALNCCSSTHDFIGALIDFNVVSEEKNSFQCELNSNLFEAYRKLVRQKIKVNECLEISLSKFVRESQNTYFNENLCDVLGSPAITAQHLKALSERGLLINNDKRLLQPRIIAEMPASFIRQQFASQTLQAATLRSIAADNAKAVNNLLLAGITLKRDKAFQLPWIHTCVLNDSVKVTKLMIRWGINVNELDTNGSAPLHTAAKSNHFKTLNVLLNQPDIQINIEDANGNTPALVAANHDSWESLEVLLSSEKLDINAENQAGKSLISFLLFSDREQILSKAINHSQIKLMPKHLINSIHRHNQYAAFSILNASPSLLKQCEKETLAVTVSHGHVEILKYLIEKGVDINKQDARGCTPLHIACEYSHPEIVEMILACPQVDLTLLDYKSQNVLSIANLAAESALAQINNSSEITPQKMQRLKNSQTVLDLLNDYLKSMYL
ncbi:hypothetical protein SOPP22_14450 [Shewanella sp. OPT22]|nr:hypothetical protein SOPP22_14450 [Shewanella sp. OPT22]